MANAVTKYKDCTIVIRITAPLTDQEIMDIVEILESTLAKYGLRDVDIHPITVGDIIVRKA